MKTANERLKILRDIAPNKPSAIANTGVVLDILKLELLERKNQTSDSNDYYENIYFAALILFLTENVSHVKTIWETKHFDFDLGSGLDYQFLLGGGVDATILHCKENSLTEIAEYIQSLKDNGELEEIYTWKNDKITYFY